MSELIAVDCIWFEVNLIIFREIKIMLYNLSNNDGSRIVQTNELIGKKFGLIERLMLNGVKSSRLTVSESSHGIQKIIQSGQQIVFSDIEMRK